MTSAGGPWGGVPPQTFLPARRVRPVRGLSTALTALVGGHGVLTFLAVPAGFAAAERYQRFHEELFDYFGSAFAGEPLGVAPGQPTTAYSVLTGVSSALSIALAVVLVLWTVRVRSNADVLAPGFPRRRSPLWAWLGWLVPFVSFVFPYQVLADARRASAAATRRPVPGPRLGWWWGTHLAVGPVSAVPALLSSGLLPAGLLGVGALLQALVVAAWVVLFVPVVRGTAALQQHP